MAESHVSEGIVLYVEDEENDAFLMQLAFERAGLHSALKVVGNGQDAIDYLTGTGSYAERSQFPVPKLVLLDLNLPVLSGFEVLAWMRRHAGYEATPVIVFSSSSREEDKTRARELGANDYVEKPSSVRLFGTLVQNLKQNWLR